MNRTAQDHLGLFIEALQQPKPLQSEIKKFLTLTQQDRNVYVGEHSVEAAINGLYSIVQNIESFSLDTKISTNEVMKDCIITITRNNEKTGLMEMGKIQCRLVKESGFRKTDIDGRWGINASSFKYLKA